MTALASGGGTLLAALAATGALWFTGQSLHATNTQLDTSQQTAATDRFRLAAEQLSSDKINVRVAGIYLFERLAKDSPADHATVYSVLTAFVRTQAPVNNCPTPPESAVAPVDIQVAMTVIGRRDSSREQLVDKPDLSGTCLVGVNLRDAHLDEVNLRGANLEHANLTGASLGITHLDRANLAWANLEWADLSLTGLTGANLEHADLFTAHLEDAQLDDANLRDADLTNARLTDVDLQSANLEHAKLTGIRYGEWMKWPEGFTPPPSR